MRALDLARDHLALQIKDELENAAYSNHQIHDAGTQVLACRALIHQAREVAKSS